MSIDERLERLTERHEALTQTVEFMVAENRDRDKRWDKRMGEIMQAIASLLHVAEIHQQRLNEHDDRLDNLDRKQ